MGFWCLLTESAWLLAGLSPHHQTSALLKSLPDCIDAKLNSVGCSAGVTLADRKGIQLLTWHLRQKTSLLLAICSCRDRLWEMGCLLPPCVNWNTADFTNLLLVHFSGYDHFFVSLLYNGWDIRWFGDIVLDGETTLSTLFSSYNNIFYRMSVFTNSLCNFHITSVPVSPKHLYLNVLISEYCAVYKTVFSDIHLPERSKIYSKS